MVTTMQLFDRDSMVKKGPNVDYIRPVHLRSEFCCASRLRRGGSELASREMEVVIVSARVSVSQIVLETC